MISFLRGKVLDKDTKDIILLVGDIGYKIILGTRHLEKIKETENIEMYIYHQQRDDAVNLYGFEHKGKLDFFNELISISGVGPKSALLLLDLLGVREVQGAIANKRPDIIARAPGLGKKTAERIIVEMKNKFLAFADENEESGMYSDEMNDVVNALTGLGYMISDARKVIKEIPAEVQGVDNKIKEALKIIGRNK
jgi:holliday junction DNA helicase RuvA